MKDPIRPRIEGDTVYAAGTTLGSDNGFGVSAALAILATHDLVHGPLELLFTLDEEANADLLVTPDATTKLHGFLESLRPALKMDFDGIDAGRRIDVVRISPPPKKVCSAGSAWPMNGKGGIPCPSHQREGFAFARLAGRSREWAFTAGKGFHDSDSNV